MRPPSVSLAALAFGSVIATAVCVDHEAADDLVDSELRKRIDVKGVLHAVVRADDFLVEDGDAVLGAAAGLEAYLDSGSELL